MSRLLHCLRRKSRRLVSAACLLSFLAAVCGVPVINPRIGANGKDVSQPFPCMQGSCGCQNADACWRGCCCHTEHEKLAWAEENGVTPPDYVRVAAAKERPSTATKVASCCQTSVRTSCCQAGDGVAARPAPAIDPVMESSKDGWQWQFVPAVSARKCQGLAQMWLLLGTAVPPEPRFELQQLVMLPERMESPDESTTSSGRLPLTPPPKA